MLVFGHPPDLSELLVFAVIFFILFHIPRDRWTPGIPGGPRRIPGPPGIPGGSPGLPSGPPGTDLPGIPGCKISFVF